jgi:uncharacterized Zn finger protein
MILSVFPFYYVAKLLLLIGCMWPDRKRNLSTIIYTKFIRVYLMRNERVCERACLLLERHGGLSAA